MRYTRRHLSAALDSAPTSQVVMAFFNLQHSLQETFGRWDALRQEGAELGVVWR